MSASSSSATHHIFFPPRLEVVVEEQHPNGFPSRTGNQSPFLGFLRHQPHGPASAALRRRSAHHGDDPLLLTVVQDLCRAGTRLVVECGIEASLLVATREVPNGLGGERNECGDARRANPLGQLQQRQCPQHDSDLLYAAAQQLPQLLLVLLLDFDTQSWSSHTPSMRQNITA